MGRLLTTTHSYNGATAVTLTENTYDEIGRLEQKELHNGYQDIDYCYNIRGWLTQMNDPTASATNSKLFAMQLYYNTDMSSTLTGTAQYNGNINGEMWRLSGGTRKGYNFNYDGLNRLTQADYGTYSSNTWTNTSAYDLSSVGYDENGNISSLPRKNSSGSNRESLSYTYSGNQLSSISGTYNGSSASGSFSYDGNGNASSDGLRGLTSIIYFDELDLPSQYYKNSGNKVDYTYDALGAKWSKTATISGTATTMLYYGPFIYESGSLSKVLTPEGYYDPTTSLYHYYLKDHLGNTRITFHYSGTTAVVDQEVEYYPFGSLFAENNLDKNTYLYNGKELNNEFFENYDYGARFYDAELGRWHSVDPMAESYNSWSLYNYALNNPLSFIDPDGMKVTKTDSSYVVTGNDIYTYYSSLTHIQNAESSIENLYAALEDASQKNDGEGGAFAATLGEQTVSANMPETLPLSAFYGKKDFRGSNGLLEYLWTRGNIDGVHYDFEGNPTGLAPITGTAPTPGKIRASTYRSAAQKAKYLKELFKSGKAPKWMTPWLKRGKVPPGYQVDHIKALSAGGDDLPANMKLKTTVDHRVRHKFYRPWQKKN